MEFTIHIKFPDLLMAATALATALNSAGRDPAAASAMPQAPVPHVNPTPTPAVPAPQTPPAAPQPAIPTVPSAPAPTPNPVVPGTEPPKYSIDDIARAGAELAQQGPDKITALTGLLQQFGLQAVTQLRPDQMGPFVLALRGLGARI